LQTTLLGIAFAIILAVVAALVGPLLIDWTAYRPLIEAQAARVLGTEVHVGGTIDGRLLPSPRLTLHNVTVGSGAEKMRADELDLQFALTPLLRGTWQAEEMRLAGPQLMLRVDKEGRLQAPALATNFDPDSLSIDRLQIEGGTLTLAAPGRDVTLTGLFFNGSARSLYGPYQGSGAFTVGNESYSLDSLSTGRLSDTGLHVRAAVQPGEHPYRIETDGKIALNSGKPQYEGNLTLSPPPGVKRGAAPWHLRGKLSAKADFALLEQAEFAYGADKQGVKLTGLVRFDYGKAPSLIANLSAPRIDLDAMFAAEDGNRRAPAAVLRQLAQASSAAAFLSSVPIFAGLRVDEVVLGGSSLTEVKGDLKSTKDGWQLEPLQFRAPGFSKVALSGALTVGNKTASFTGPVDINAGDPRVLFAWLEGRGQLPASNARPLTLQGHVTLGPETIALDDMRATVEGEPLRGHLAYSFGGGKQGARLDAALAADKLDLETGFAFVKALSAGSQIEMPESIALSANIGRASFSGFSGRDAAADITYDKKGLTIRKLSVADLGGANLNIDGQLAFGTGSKQPGKLQADLRAPDLKPVLAVLSRVAPAAAAALQPSERAPANLHAEVTVRPGAPLNRTDLKLSGALGGMDLSLDADAAADLTSGTIGQMHLDARIAAADGRTLLPLLRLDHAIEVGDGPGALSLKANGKFSGRVAVSATATANGLDASVTGTADLSTQRSANLQIAVRQANAAPLQGVGGIAPLPVSYTSQLVLKGDTLSLNSIKASVGTAKLNGKLTLGLGDTTQIGGALDVDTAFDAPAALAAGLGSRLASVGRDARWTWSSDPFLPSSFGKFDGDVQLTANRLRLLPTIEGRRFTGTLHFGQHEIAARGMKGEVAGGTLQGDLTFQQGADGVSLDSHLALSGADATVLVGSGARPPLTGTMGFDVALEGAGLSPVALIGSLHGQGKVTLTDAQIAGLDARAFDVVTRAVDTGVPIEPARVTDIVGKALDSGGLKVKQAEGALSIAAGQVRLARVKAASEDADLEASGTLDLTDGRLDSRLILSGAASASGMRPDIYMALSGPLAEPQRSVDVAALTGWLTLRAVELQAQKVKALEEAEAKRRADEEAAAKRGAEEARRRVEEEAKRRADAEAKRRAVEQVRRHADDEAKLRALLGTPALDPAPAAHSAMKPARAHPAEAAVTIQPSSSGPQQPAPGLLPLIESAPLLPPPVNVARPPGALPRTQ
jgi:uncharacterized protein involved in outer membrane biogenesis